MRLAGDPRTVESLAQLRAGRGWLLRRRREGEAVCVEELRVGARAVVEQHLVIQLIKDIK